MQGKSDKCVICGYVGSHEGSMIKMIANGSLNSSEKECLKLQQQLSVIFLLRKMLRIPQARLEVLLVKYGDPSDWNISTCSPCNRVFVEAVFVHERISKLHCEFEELSLKLRKHIRDSKESILHAPSPSSSTPITGSRKRRKRGRPKAKYATKLNLNILSDDIGLPEVIRQELLNGTNSNQAGSMLKKTPVQTTTGERSRKVAFNLPIVKVEPIDSTCGHDSIDHSNSTHEETIDDVDEPSILDEIELNFDNDDDPVDSDFVASSPSPSTHFEDDDNNDKHCDLEKDEKTTNDDPNHNKITESEVMNNMTAPQPIKDELGYKCPLCPRTSLTKCSSHGHILRAHYNQDKPYYCHLCLTRWRTEAKLRQHLEDEHSCRTTPLDDPEEMLSVESSHIPQPIIPQPETGSRSRRFKCDLCRKQKYRVTYKSLETLEAHKKLVHLGIKNPYSCKQCGKSFKTSLVLRHHAYVHQRREIEKKVSTKKKSFCEKCNLSFNSMAALKSHLKTKTHAGENEYPFQCELCPKGFFQMPSLENHHRQEHFEQLKIDPFKCPQCDMLLSGKRALDHHIRVIHTKDTLYRCEPCNLGFMFVNVYKKHMSVVHAKEKPYLCSYCPKRFSNRSHLETHTRVHTGEKPYKCPNCDKEYADKPTFRRHVETHGEQVYECNICENRKFKIWHTYRLHMKTHNQKVHKKPSHRLFHEPSSTSTNNSKGDINLTSQDEEVEVAGTITNHLEPTDAAISFKKETNSLLEIDTELTNTLAI